MKTLVSHIFEVGQHDGEHFDFYSNHHREVSFPVTANNLDYIWNLLKDIANSNDEIQFQLPHKINLKSSNRTTMGDYSKGEINLYGRKGANIGVLLHEWAHHLDKLMNPDGEPDADKLTNKAYDRAVHNDCFQNFHGWLLGCFICVIKNNASKWNEINSYGLDKEIYFMSRA